MPLREAVAASFLPRSLRSAPQHVPDQEGRAVRGVVGVCADMWLVWLTARHHVPPYGGTPDTACVVQAAKRQQKFEQSAVGKATYTAERNARKHTGPNRPDQTAQDWLT